jgi:hypothetical protein
MIIENIEKKDEKISTVTATYLIFAFYRSMHFQESSQKLPA